MTTISPVTIPYTGNIPGGLHDGLEIEIQGTIPHHSQGFAINLSQSPDVSPTTVVHFNPRFNENCVVRNHMHNKNWGGEERHGGMPFQKGNSFDVDIKVKSNEIEFKVNGREFADFKHRLPKETAQYLLISGDVVVNKIQYGGKGVYDTHGMPGPYGGEPYPMGGGFAPPGGYSAPSGYPSGGYSAGGYPAGGYPAGGAPPTAASTGYTTSAQGYNPGGVPAASAGFGGSGPIYNPPVPFKAPIPGGLYPGRMIHIIGAPNPNCSRFCVNLQSGMQDGCDILLHIDARLAFGNDRNVLVRNHCHGGNWGKEERQAPNFPFMPNANFDILILADAAAFKIAVNNQHLLEFPHRIPLQNATTLSIGGDVHLTEIRFQ